MTPLQFGPLLLDNRRTRFRLWAPACDAVTLSVESVGDFAMTRRSGGWFETEAPCGPGSAYRFRLPDGLCVPDPASRAQRGGVHGESVVIDERAYRWKTPDWRGRPWRETVLYELHVGLCGGFCGVQEMLPRLRDLGVTAVELMPISAFPGARNWGYDGVLPFAPAKAYGTPDDLKALIDAAHGLGMMMFLDVVYNHFGPDGNYLGAYAPAFFDAGKNNAWGGAIDFSQPDVRRYFTENAIFWLDAYRFDGLRLDAVHAIEDRGWLDEMAAAVRVALPGRHIHLVLENDDNIASHLTGDFDAQWNDDAHHAMHLLLTGEKDGYYADYAGEPAKKMARALYEGFIYQGEASAHRGGRKRGEPSGHLPPTAFVFFLQNHDQIGNRAHGERLSSLADPEALEAAIGLQCLCPQIPLLFMGEEEASKTPFLYFTDHDEALAKAVREGRAREFAAFGGFASDGPPDPNAPATFEASRPRPDPQHAASRFALYKHLLDLRARLIAPRLDGAICAASTPLGDAGAGATWRLGDGARLTLAVNVGSESAAMPPSRGELLHESRAGVDAAAREGTLKARSFAAFLEPP